MTMKKLLERIDSIERKQTTTLTEGVEQINEISADLVARYKEKATRRQGVHNRIAASDRENANNPELTTAQRMAASELADRQQHKADMRARGIEKATARQARGGNAGKVSEQGVAEGIRDDAMAGLQKTIDFAKQHGYKIYRSSKGRTLRFVNSQLNHELRASVDNDGDSINVNWMDYLSGTSGNDNASYFDQVFKDAYEQALKDHQYQSALDDEDDDGPYTLSQLRMLKKQGVAEGKGSKPDYIDLDGDGNRKESMKKAAADKKHHKKPVQEARPPMDEPPPRRGHQPPVIPGGNPEDAKGSQSKPYGKAPGKPAAPGKAPRKVYEDVYKLLHPHFGNPSPDYFDDNDRVQNLLRAIYDLNQKQMVYDLEDQDQADMDELQKMLDFYAKRIGSNAATEMQKYSDRRNRRPSEQERIEQQRRENAPIRGARNQAYAAAQRGIARMESQGTHSKKSTVKESWTDFDDAKKAHEKAGSTVTGRPEDYTVTMMDGTRKRFINKEGKRKIETLPPVRSRQDDEDDEAPAKPTKSADKKAAPQKEGGKKRGRPAGSKNKKKVSEMTESEFHQFMRGVMLIEERMSDEDKAEKKRIVKGMEENPEAVRGLKKRYKGRWKDVMHATATKKAMESLGITAENILFERGEAAATFFRNMLGGMKNLKYDNIAGRASSGANAGKVVNVPAAAGSATGSSIASRPAVFALGGLTGAALAPDRTGGTPPAPPPALAPPPVPTSTGQTGQMYKIGQGDTLSQIAGKRGVSVKDLLAANPEITNPDRIRAGQEIRLPGAISAQSTPTRTEPGRSYSPQAFQGTMTPPPPTVIPGSSTGGTSSSTKPADIYAGGVGTVANTQANIGTGYFQDSPESRLAAQRAIASPAGMPNEPGSGPNQMLGQMIDKPVPPIPPKDTERENKYTPGQSATDYLATQRATMPKADEKQTTEDLDIIRRLSGLK